MGYPYANMSTAFTKGVIDRLIINLTYSKTLSEAVYHHLLQVRLAHGFILISVIHLAMPFSYM